MFGACRTSKQHLRPVFRIVCACLFFFALTAPSLAQPAIKISAARVWPAAEYTRITLESKQPISFNHFLVNNPERIVVDLENVEISNPLSRLSAKIGADDPYIKSVRIGRFKPGVVRLVFDLKAEAKPSVFTTKPYGEYGYRLVLDIYPAHPVDPSWR